MAKHKTVDIRNIALLGHGGAGKTLLAEAMLHAGKVTTRLGSVTDGTAVTDFEPDEHERGISINAALAHLDWKGRFIQIVDCPGYADFVGEAVVGLSAAETALLVANAVKGVEIGTRKAWELAEAGGAVARMIVINKCDGEYAKFDETLAALQASFGKACVPLSVPDGEGSAFTRVVSVLDPPADLAGDLAERVAKLRNELIETVVSADDALLERYLEDAELSDEEIEAAFRAALASGAVVPVLACAAEKELGVDVLLDAVARFAPDPLAAKRVVREGKGEGDEAVETPVELSESGSFLGQVFKIKSDIFVGKLAFIRVLAGSIKGGTQVTIASTGKTAKLPGLLRYQGKEQSDAGEAVAGDIVAVAKLENLTTGETLAAKGTKPLARVDYPVAMVSLAVEAKSRGDEQKITAALRKLADEDPTFCVERRAQTKELVVSGMGQLHLDVYLGRLKSRFDLEVITRIPKVPYLETITQRAEYVEYTHKKQTGGAGQFARVFINLVPNERGKGYEFVDKIVGGVIDQPFRGSVDKGIRAKMAEGVVAGYPVIDCIVELVDGKTHPVYSKDIAFQIAGREAFKKAVGMAKPVLLEPVVNMEIVVPSRFMGDITGDISGRRGRILGMDTLGEMQVVKAQAPLAEVQRYSTELRALTGGEGFYAVELSHYDPVPSNIAQQIAAAAKREEEER